MLDIFWQYLMALDVCKRHNDMFFGSQLSFFHNFRPKIGLIIKQRIVSHQNCLQFTSQSIIHHKKILLDGYFKQMGSKLNSFNNENFQNLTKTGILVKLLPENEKELLKTVFCLWLSHGFCMILAINNMQDVSRLLHRALLIKSIFKDTF